MRPTGRQQGEVRTRKCRGEKRRATSKKSRNTPRENETRLAKACILKIHRRQTRERKPIDPLGKDNTRAKSGQDKPKIKHRKKGKGMEDSKLHRRPERKGNKPQVT